MSPSFIAAFKVNLHVFGYTKPLSILLQGSTMDILTTYQEIKTVKIILAELRRDTEKEFNPIYAGMVTMANAAGLDTMSIPRRCRLQTARNNVESATLEEYWRRAVFVPFMDRVIKEFEERFSQLSENSIRGLKVILSRVTSLSAEDEECYNTL